ncbi:hypothetical protein CFC21_100684, partial [Triticum aestivum]
MPGAGHVHYLVAGGSGGGDDPRYPWTFKSLHEVDAVVPAIARGAPVGPDGCPICFRTFASAKAVHGHMRSHTDRSWRGMEPPRETPLASSGRTGSVTRTCATAARCLSGRARRSAATAPATMVLCPFHID